MDVDYSANLYWPTQGSGNVLDERTQGSGNTMGKNLGNVIDKVQGMLWMKELK